MTLRQSTTSAIHAEMVERAEALLSGTGWLPPLVLG
jgi:hypothetical protein